VFEQKIRIFFTGETELHQERLKYRNKILGCKNKWMEQMKKNFGRKKLKDYFSFVPKNHRECSQVTGMFAVFFKV